MIDKKIKKTYEEKRKRNRIINVNRNYSNNLEPKSNTNS